MDCCLDSGTTVFNEVWGWAMGLQVTFYTASHILQSYVYSNRADRITASMGTETQHFVGS